MHEAHILVLQLLHVPHDLSLGVIRVEDGMSEEGRRAVERCRAQAAVQLHRRGERLR